MWSLIALVVEAQLVVVEPLVRGLLEQQIQNPDVVVVGGEVEVLQAYYIQLMPVVVVPLTQMVVLK